MYAYTPKTKIYGHPTHAVATQNICRWSHQPSTLSPGRLQAHQGLLQQPRQAPTRSAPRPVATASALAVMAQLAPPSTSSSAPSSSHSGSSLSAPVGHVQGVCTVSGKAMGPGCAGWGWPWKELMCL
jgi:hypothetical protein